MPRNGWECTAVCGFKTTGQCVHVQTRTFIKMQTALLYNMDLFVTQTLNCSTISSVNMPAILVCHTRSDKALRYVSRICYFSTLFICIP